MKKTLTAYKLGEARGNSVPIFKNGIANGSGTLGVVSALESIFVEEGSNREDWFIVENGIVFKVNRKEWNISHDRETLFIA